MVKVSKVQWLLTSSVLLMSLVASQGGAADVIQFPDEELAVESVLPVFDDPVSVKNRNVVTAKRFEIGGGVGYSLLDPWWNPVNFNLMTTYHFNEEHGLNIFGNYFFATPSSYSSNANSISYSDGTAVEPLKLELSPKPNWLLLASYQYTAFYGKLSLSKQTVINLSTYGLVGLGAYSLGDEILPGLSAGVGQKYYLSSNFAMRWDLQFFYYQGPNPVKPKISPSTMSGTQKNSVYEKEFAFLNVITVGATYMFPGL